jgi:tRNA-dihydrouridine synthase
MSGVTDAPFRRLVARLGAGLVVSEMTASEALVEGRRDAVLRAEGQGSGLHVVQLAGCEPRWMAEGARIAEGAGAAIVDINMGCPAKHVANRQSGSALMRDLGRANDQRARACTPRAGRRRAYDHRAWTHAMPVL